MKRKAPQIRAEKSASASASRIKPFHPNQIYTFQTPRLQAFSIPPDVISYLIQNNQIAQIHDKLIRSCKYFFSKKSVILVTDLKIPSKTVGFRIIESRNWIKKFWFLGSCVAESSGENIGISQIIPKIYQCDLTFLHLINQQIRFSEFHFLVSSEAAETIHLDNVLVEGDDGSVILKLEDILKTLPKIKKFY